MAMNTEPADANHPAAAPVPPAPARRARQAAFRRIGSAPRPDPGGHGLHGLTLLAKHLSNAVLVCGRSGHIEWVNAAFTAMTGYRPEESLGRTPADLLGTARQAPGFDVQLRRALSRDGHWEGEAWRRCRDGRTIQTWMCVSAVHDADGDIRHFVAVYTDLTPIRRADEVIRHMAFHDMPTGLPNRRLLQDRLAQALAVCRRQGTRAAVLSVSLDGFGHFTSGHGHDAGDDLLAEMAQRFQHCVRGVDTVARPHANEFAVIVTGLSPTARLAAFQAGAVADKLRAAAGSPHVARQARYHGGVSIGISMIDADCASPEQAHKQACIALHEAQRAGRKGLRFFDPLAQQAVQERLDLEADLRAAIDQDELALHLQPQVRADGSLSGAEALLRWQHRTRGPVPPGRFIPLAEESALIIDLGRWVLRAACRILRAWAGLPGCAGFDLSINVSGRQLAHPGFVDDVRDALQCAGASPGRLVIELTESAVLEDADDAAAKLAALRRLGVRTALDDFGTGQSSLTYLSRLPLDQLKIDQSFVQRMHGNPNDAILVQTIIRMADGLGLDVIAEGVETAAQRHSLLTIGCPGFQGYLFGKPMAEAQFIETFSAVDTPAHGLFGAARAVGMR